MNNNELAQQITRLADIQEIANLQGRYLFYVQAHDYEAIVDMFAKDDPEVSVEVAEGGVYVGIEKVRAMFVDLIKPFFTSAGTLPVHMLTTPVIEIQPDGETAYGMWQTLGCNTFPGEEGLCATWQQGKYDNIFVKENGQWRFKQFRWLCNFRTPFDQGWVKQPMLNVEPLDLSNFPESTHPTRTGEYYAPYDPEQEMHFGPRPPEPIKPDSKL